MRIVKLLRLLLGIGQRSLAEKAGISIRELARIESGEIVPGQGLVLLLDRAFDSIVKERLRAAS